MDGFEEKKWFVYLGDHHEGPFSLAEIQAKMGEGQVTSSSYVWAEGMSDWKVMTEVSAFEALMSPVGASSAAMPQAFSDIALEPAPSPEPILEAAPRPGQAAPSHQQFAAAVAETPLEPVEAPVQLESVQLTAQRPEASPRSPAGVTEQDLRNVHRADTYADPAPPKRSLLKRLFFLILILAAAGTGANFYLNTLDPEERPAALVAVMDTVSEAAEPVLSKAVDAVPVLGKWFSPIPRLEDVSPEDYESLKLAAGAKLEQDGPKVAVALSSADLLSPVFYVATNLPDGTALDVYVEGVPETLLNQLSFSSRARAVVTRKLGKTAAVKFGDNQSLPRGQYEIFAVEAEEQSPEVKAMLGSLPPAAQAKAPVSMPKGLKLVATKSYFLGGNKDATYTARLKEFHDKLREKATRELGEIKQFHATLESTLNAGLSDFTAISKIRAPGIRRKKWDEHKAKWSAFATQMTEIFQKWTPEVLGKEFFYGPLYTLIQQTFASVEQLHNLHHEYFTTTVDQKAFDIRVGQASAAATSSVVGLKAKIEQAEKIPPAPNGMPRREGL